MGSGTRYRKKFLAANPICAFCGGVSASTTIEHCPPRAMFQDRQWPEGFEFPSCERCNRDSGEHDLLISVFGRMNPFEDLSNADNSLSGLVHLANKQFPGLLRKMMPSAIEARRKNREHGIVPLPGQTHQEAGALKVTNELNDAVGTLASKLSKGLFYREAQSVFPSNGCLAMNWFTNADLYRDGKYIAFDSLKELAGSSPPTIRSGKHLGDQFEYKFTLASERTAFVLQARFSAAFGFVVFGGTIPGVIESGITRLRDQTGRSGPFAILQSETLK